MDELEKVGYDTWKLSNGDDEIRRSLRRLDRIGRCPLCEEDIFNFDLYEENDDGFYHRSCYEEIKEEEV